MLNSNENKPSDILVCVRHEKLLRLRAPQLACNRKTPPKDQEFALTLSRKSQSPSRGVSSSSIPLPESHSLLYVMCNPSCLSPPLTPRVYPNMVGF